MNYRERKKLEKTKLLTEQFNNYDDITNLIQSHLMTDTQKVSTSKINHPIFKQSKAYREILDKTSFLDTSVSYSQRIYCIINNITQIPKCVICNSDTIYLPNKDRCFSKTCGKQTCKTKESNERRMQTIMKKYNGKASPRTISSAKSRSKNLYIKGRKTLQEKYGVINPSQLADHLDKCRQTLINRYGVNHQSKIPHVIELKKEQRLDFLQQLTNSVKIIDILPPEEYKNELFQTPCDNIKFNCNNCNKDEILNYETFKWRARNINTVCSSCSGITSGSNAQYEIAEFIKTFDPNIEVNNKSIIHPLELDIVSEEHKIAIEYDGIYWHSFNRTENAAERRYHLNKTLRCQENNYQLIHIFENEWINKREIVKSRLTSLFGKSNRIYARKCRVEEISSKESSAFIDYHHIQGNVKSSVHLALIYKNQIVAVMTFRKPRFNKKVQWEIIRFCTIYNTNIIGGASKLFKAFVNKYQPNSVISYADRRWGEGKVYLKLGFKHVSSTSPNYYYYKQGSLNLLNRINFQKHKLPKLLINFNSTLTEAENMFNNNYRRIWDCGNQKYIWEK